jgi:hypothetical protein
MLVFIWKWIRFAITILRTADALLLKNFSRRLSLLFICVQPVNAEEQLQIWNFSVVALGYF